MPEPIDPAPAPRCPALKVALAVAGGCAVGGAVALLLGTSAGSAVALTAGAAILAGGWRSHANHRPLADALHEAQVTRRRLLAEVDGLSRIPQENPNPVLRLDGQGVLLSVNTAGRVLVADLGGEAGAPGPHYFADLARECFATGADREAELTHNGRVLAFVFHPVPAADFVVAYGQDVTDRTAAEERLDHLSSHDLLTGLANRRLFTDRLRQALRAGDARTRALLLVEVEGLKDVNRSLGHAAGDALLEIMANRVRQVVAPSDTLGRLDADEFTVLRAPGTDADATATLAQALLDRLEAPVEVADHALTMRVAVGIAMAPADGETAEAVLQAAVTARNQVKEEDGRGYRFFVAGMTDAVRRRKEMERDLRRALAGAEFRLYYQAKVSLTDGRLVGAEALIRWQDPERGLRSPGEFIPIAERSGLILPMGAWALRQACTQIAAWQAAGLTPVPVAVNLSAGQFTDPNLVTLVATILQESGVDPGLLEVEITETAAMDRPEAAITTMNGLRALGVSLAIDDFGTGYSSLSYLQRLPVQHIKVDKAFIDDMALPPHESAIARAVTGLAHVLDRTVTAEGVETDAQCQHLRAYGCDHAQGFLFGRPEPAHVFVERL